MKAKQIVSKIYLLKLWSASCILYNRQTNHTESHYLTPRSDWMLYDLLFT